MELHICDGPEPLCAQETLRRWSVVPVVTRRAAVDDQICGYKIPKGTYIACLLSAVHAREWKDPQQWRPERFLPGGDYNCFEDGIRPHTVRPFSKAACCLNALITLAAVLWKRCAQSLTERGRRTIASILHTASQLLMLLLSPILDEM